jgi:hypothetical protein
MSDGRKLVLVIGAALLVSIVLGPSASAQPTAPVAKEAKDCLAGIWQDEFGNEYSFKGKSSGCTTSYKIRGSLTYGAGLQGLPWKISGSGMSTSIAFEVIASAKGQAAGGCSFVVHATVSGSPPAESASGTYSDLSPCSGGNIFYMVQDSDVR